MALMATGCHGRSYKLKKLIKFSIHDIAMCQNHFMHDTNCNIYNYITILIYIPLVL